MEESGYLGPMIAMFDGSAVHRDVITRVEAYAGFAHPDGGRTAPHLVVWCGQLPAVIRVPDYETACAERDRIIAAVNSRRCGETRPPDAESG